MNRKFLIINKLFLSMFVMAIFLGLGFVGAIYPSYEDSNDCGQIPNYSSYSNDGDSYVTNGTYILSWYVNKESAIGRAADGSSSVNGVCDDYPELEGLATRTDWKKDLCNSNPGDLKSHQQDLFTYYSSTIDYNFTWGFDDKEKVWGLQNLMKQAKCHTHRDCKLGVVTISDFLFCNVCKSINEERESTNSTDPEDCPEGFIPVEGVDCCEKQIPCETPTIKINGGDDETYDDETDSIEVEVDFSENSADVFDMWNPLTNVDVVGGNKVAYTVGDRKINFRIEPPFNETQITITVPEDQMRILGGAICPGAEAILNKVAVCPDPTIFDVTNNIGCCMPKDNRQDCVGWENFEVINTEDGTTVDFAKLNNYDCDYEFSLYPFCTCDIIPENGECPDGLVNEDGCCIECPEGKIEVDGECKCDPNKTCNKDGYVVDPATCKCKCDPSKRCCGIELNTVVPFIGDCIEMTSQNNTMDPNDPNTSRVNQLNAFPFLMMGLSKILVTAILIFSFLIVIAAGVMMVTGVANESNFTEGKKWIKNVVVALILLGTSGLILKLINPSFFGG